MLVTTSTCACDFEKGWLVSLVISQILCVMCARCAPAIVTLSLPRRRETQSHLFPMIVELHYLFLYVTSELLDYDVHVRCCFSCVYTAGADPVLIPSLR